MGLRLPRSLCELQLADHPHMPRWHQKNHCLLWDFQCMNDIFSEVIPLQTQLFWHYESSRSLTELKISWPLIFCWPFFWQYYFPQCPTKFFLCFYRSAKWPCKMPSNEQRLDDCVRCVEKSREAELGDCSSSCTLTWKMTRGQKDSNIRILFRDSWEAEN